jgi:very-short-patch-repair endonuclease
MLSLKFHRQHVLHGFIVDFYCPRLRLILELDGVPHTDATRVSYDAARTTFLEARGYRVMRLRNQEVNRERLKELLRPLVSRPESPLSRTGEGVRGSGTGQ